jgi:hypothetical protein
MSFWLDADAEVADAATALSELDAPLKLLSELAATELLLCAS